MQKLRLRRVPHRRRRYWWKEGRGYWWKEDTYISERLHAFKGQVRRLLGLQVPSAPVWLSFRHRHSQHLHQSDLCRRVEAACSCYGPCHYQWLSRKPCDRLAWVWAQLTTHEISLVVYGSVNDLAIGRLWADLPDNLWVLHAREHPAPQRVHAPRDY